VLLLVQADIQHPEDLERGNCPVLNRYNLHTGTFIPNLDLDEIQSIQIKMGFHTGRVLEVLALTNARFWHKANGQTNSCGLNIRYRLNADIQQLNN